MSHVFNLRSRDRRGWRAAGGLCFVAGLAVTAAAFLPGPLAAGATAQSGSGSTGGGSAKVAAAQQPSNLCGIPDVPRTPEFFCIVSTKLSSDLVLAGTPVTDTASITFPDIPSAPRGVATPTASPNTVTFNIYDDNSNLGPDACTGDPLTSIGPVDVDTSTNPPSASSGPITTGVSGARLAPGKYEFQAVYTADGTTAGMSECGTEPLEVIAPDSLFAKSERDLGPGATAEQDPATPAYVSDIHTALTGDVLQYQFMYSNTGTAGARDIVVTDAIPAGTSYLAGSCIIGGDSGFTCDDSVPGTITLTHLSSLPAGTSPFLVGSFKVTITATAPFTILNQASFDSIGVLPQPTKPVRAAMTTSPRVAIQPHFTGTSTSVSATGPKNALSKAVRDLGASSGVTPASDPSSPQYAGAITNVVSGDVLQFRLTYGNIGSAAATNVTISDQIPGGTSYYNPGSVSSCLAAAGWTCDDHSTPGFIRLTNPSVAAGTSGVAGTFKVLVTASGDVNIHNVASVTSSAESTPLQAAADATGHVIPAVPVSALAKEERNLGPNALPGDDTATPAYTTSVAGAVTGDVMQYRLTYSNNGAGTATSVAVTDTFPADTTFLSGSCLPAPGFTCTPNASGVAFTIASVAPNTTVVVGSFKVTIDVPAPFAITNVAGASATGNGTVPSNQVIVESATGAVQAAATTTPTTGAGIPFGLGITLMLLGAALTGIAARRSRRT